MLRMVQSVKHFSAV
jgi:glutamate dehydrogenase (NAD(P)+)